MSDLEALRHSTAHILAKAVQRLHPGARLGIGPVIEDGFYYDIDTPRPLTDEDLPAIEKEMQRIIKAAETFERVELSREEALTHYATQEPNPYKREIIEGIPGDETISFYRTGEDWQDLCRGPHIHSSKEVPAFKLLSIAGAYWRGDEHRPMLQRIYGTAWPTQEELDQYLWRLEEAKKRDHRRLGREMDLFSTHEEVGPGLILWHPKGGRIRNEIEQFWRKEHYAGGYELVYTPNIGRGRLWETSGHLDFYRESMFAGMEMDEQEYFAKPMNCPFHIMVYKNALRSYRELPMRLGELGTVYRYEKPGVLHGLLRVRGFTQDDAHIFCRPEQVEDEIVGVLKLNQHILHSFGFQDFELYLSTRPEKSVGRDEDWQHATEALRMALERMELPFEMDDGGGAFYGPKIDWKIKDALGRSWQCSTVQFDFNLPERFDLAYIGEDGAHHRPYMVHRALLGSMERFFGVLLEHYGGALPLWLAPVQALIIPIADRHLEYAESVAAELRQHELRVDVDGRRESMRRKIRDAEVQKVPYMLVVGDRDIESGAASLRERSAGDLGPKPIAEISAMLMERRSART